MNQLLIELKSVWKRFGANEVLKGVDLSIFKGQVTTIIGKSGGGKTVLLKLIMGLIQPDSGEVYLYGIPLSKVKASQRERAREKFSYVFQDAALFDSMTVYKNIALPLEQGTKMAQAEIRTRVQDKMQLFELAEFEDRYPSQISGGMKRRVALARAMVNEPEAVLFDEPTAGLDPIRRNAVHSMIVQYQKKFGFTAVMVSHEIPEVFYFSQRIAMLDEGKIRFEGIPEEIRTCSDPVVQEFVQGLERPHDALTGMATQLQGERRYMEELARMQRHRIVFSVIILAVENVDKINEKMGHVTGQEVIKNFASEVQRRLDITDSCARYSLNKILVVLHDADLAQARRLSDRLGSELRSSDLLKSKSHHGLDIWISAGFAEAEEDSTIKEILAKAELKDSSYHEFRLK
jgi:phospholipid/cholesterol/gamma-HCH transport system ATP-binding protein